MKTATLVIGSLVCAASLFAQGIESCSGCVCSGDAGCEGHLCSTDIYPGALTPFTVTCTGNWTIRAVLSCDDDEYCEVCCACVQILHNGSVIGQCHTVCEAGNCTNEAGCSSVALQSGNSYSIVAYLTTCGEDGSGCSRCEEHECVARGYVYKGTFATASASVMACSP